MCTLNISALYGMVVARGRRKREMGTYCLVDTEFYFCKMKKSVEDGW